VKQRRDQADFDFSFLLSIIEPVASRCSKFRFRPLATGSSQARIEMIAQNEGVDYEPGVSMSTARTRPPIQWPFCVAHTVHTRRLSLTPLQGARTHPPAGGRRSAQSHHIPPDRTAITRCKRVSDPDIIHVQYVATALKSSVPTLTVSPCTRVERSAVDTCSR
jgi:hypothetical protein